MTRPTPTPPLELLAQALEAAYDHTDKALRLADQQVQREVLARDDPESPARGVVYALRDARAALDLARVTLAEDVSDKSVL